jgi:hypothetical protein
MRILFEIGLLFIVFGAAYVMYRLIMSIFNGNTKKEKGEDK